jgi:putative ABC transport system permease protein
VSLWQDLRFAVRLLIKDRWFTLVAALVLALGIAANHAVFTFVNAVLIRGVPFIDPNRIVALSMRDTRNRNLGVSYPDFEDWRRTTRSFSDLALMFQVTMNVSDEGHPAEQYTGAYVSGRLFKLIGQRPILGRDFTADDDTLGAAGVVMLGNGVWRARYGGDPTVLGRTITVNAVPSTIIGVMPPDMRFPPNSDLWQPLTQSTSVREWGRQVRNYQLIGRLADGVTIGQARAEISAVASRLASEHPETNKDLVPEVMTYNERVRAPQLRLIFWSLMGAVGFVLLIACANLANLLLARAAQRSREMSVRISIGATRWRIVRQLLVESVLLASLGGILSLPLAILGIRFFDAATQDVGKPYWMEFSMDGQVFAFFAAICLGTGVIFGLAPALHVSRTNVHEVLKEGGRSASSSVRARRWTGALIVIELALTLVLLAGAGFMMRSFLALYRMDLGIDTSQLLTMQLAVPGRKYQTSADRSAFFRRVEDRLGVVSAIEAATTTSNLPLGGGAVRQLAIDGRTPPAGERLPLVTMLSVGPRYFDVLGLRLTRGRAFTDTDGSHGHEAAIVNQRFATLHFAGEDPIGRRIQLTEETPTGPQTGWATIIGVSPTVRQRDRQDVEDDPVVYLPHLGNPNQGRGVTLLVRTRAEPGRIATLLRQEIGALDADIPLFNIRTMDEFLATRRWEFLVFGTMFAIFAGIALVLSAVGLYGVTAYSVTQRTQEIGVRMALGAQPQQVVWLIVRRSLVQLAFGLTAGMAGAFGVGKLLESLLVQISTRDPVTLLSIAAVMIAVSLAACFWPARRATQLDPLSALRYE